MNAAQFFESLGLTPKRFPDGLLAIPNGKPCGNPYATINVPRCGEEYDGALLTCFVHTEDELFVAVLTACLVADKMSQDRNEAGRL